MARVIAREISTPARRSWPTAHGSCPAARCEAPAVAQGCPFPTLFPYSSGHSRSFRALSTWHGSLLGKFRPRLGGVGPRLTARALRLGARPRPWLKASRFLPFSHSAPGNHVLVGPLAYGTGHRSGNFDPGSAELAHGSRLVARPRPWLKATRFLPFSHSAPGNHILVGPLAYGTGHCSGNFDPGSAELAHGSRLVPCGSLRGPGRGSRLAFFFPLRISLRPITFL